MKASNLSLDNNTPSALHFAYPVSTVTSKHLRPPPPQHITSHRITYVHDDKVHTSSIRRWLLSIRYHQTCLQPWIQHNTTQYKTISYRMYLQARPSIDITNTHLQWNKHKHKPPLFLSVRHVLKKIRQQKPRHDMTWDEMKYSHLASFIWLLLLPAVRSSNSSAYASTSRNLSASRFISVMARASSGVLLPPAPLASFSTSLPT